ncbi:hypothetical protein [Planococcus soli]|uniref:hypothetical protein n=1 Tax=Planococcus soli TaxID=2666072 RepID=UPI00115CC923|nr:hypothetical protein [Planococcus soli]
MSCSPKNNTKSSTDNSSRPQGINPKGFSRSIVAQNTKKDMLVQDGEVHHAKLDWELIKIFDETGKLIQQSGSVLLAIGFNSTLPGKEWLIAVIKTHQLKFTSINLSGL